ncbi:TetR/AcrR family transcriptional regulator C-terminal domain-containing protein [Amycolatopsis sp. OK19-0408]|uniref:TetR/AcrR family transcriptional regulator C-terminal domain-containing protein n=1 Tax=Amycolatopsis iheyensis TaxID=2945988 RepID=A0A9X2SHX4_9PSEU|nr:TetR/AcrR family transcriptional regulator C-terminal domain-containing protein [Amycolatopsis iheyensis]MCR6482303.1 TetR/AcrR family transcriptional regulator C-terminal domain-containing protein [Amycolatopsis iheyensis]
MTGVENTSGDPRRTIELLWGVSGPPRRGPKPKLTTADVVQAAVALADADTIDAVTIRGVADHLGVSPMSLYTYVPGRAELLDLMIDHAHGELPAPEPGLGWRDALTAIAQDQWELFHRHPWLLQVTTSRSALGPHSFAKYEHELRALDGIGLDDVEMDAAAGLVTNLVRATARSSIDAARLVRTSGLTDAQWWERAAPVLAGIPAAAAEHYPIASRVGQAAGETHNAAEDPAYTFRFGLARVLDGIEALISERQQ